MTAGLLPSLAVPVVAAGSAPVVATGAHRKHGVGAYYYGPWHVDPQIQASSSTGRTGRNGGLSPP